MKKDKVKNKNSLQTRAELINRSRVSVVRDKLPKPSEGMFDGLRSFKQGTRDYIDLSQSSE